MSASVRFASPNERRTISREDVDFYRALVIGAVYETDVRYADISSVHTFFHPLKCCVDQYPLLSVIVKDKHTEKAFYEQVPSLDLEQHITILRHESDLGEQSAIENVLPQILDRPWDDNIPPWRLVVLPLNPLHGNGLLRCFVAFAFSHTIGDGMVGLTFHRTLLRALQQASGQVIGQAIVKAPQAQLPAPFDTADRLPISWTYLLGPLSAVYLPKFIATALGLRAAVGTIDEGTWTASNTFHDSVSFRSRVKLLEIEYPLVEKALQASRLHDTKFTAVMHQIIVRALSKALKDPSVTNFVSQTAVDMRGSIGAPGEAWGLFVSGHNDVHPKVSDSSKPGLSTDAWASASAMTKSLADCATRLQDQSIGLLRFAPSIRKWTLGKLGGRRDGSYEVSNLLAFDGNAVDLDAKVKISKLVFSQPANVPSAPLVFNIVSVKGESLVCAVSWQAGALDMPDADEMAFVDLVCTSIREDLEAL